MNCHPIMICAFEWSVFLIVVGTMWGVFLFLVSFIRMAVATFSEIRKGEW